ncbi:MAG: ABC transporter ATP-binding protein [Planctomycetota bacterium]
MSAHTEDPDAPASTRISPRLWRGILRTALEERTSAVLLVGGGIAIAAIEATRPLVNAALIDEAVANGITPRFWWIAAAWGAMAAGFAIGVATFIRSAGRVSAGLAFRMRERAFARLQELDFGYFDRRPAGWLVSRVTADCGKVSGIAPWVILDAFWATTIVGLSAACMLWLDWRVAAWMLALLPALAAMAAFFQARLLRSSRLVRRSNSRIMAYLGESINGVRTTKSLAREPDADAEFTALATEMEGHSVRNSFQSAVFVPIVTSASFLGVAIALWRGGLLAGDGAMGPGTLVAFMQYALLFTWPVIDASQRVVDLLSAQAAAERVQSLIDTVPGIRDSPAVAARIALARPAPGEAPDGGRGRIGRVAFEGVSFAYVEGEPVLSGFSLDVRAGETVALVGPTGAGKSTIVNLAARFYEPTAGRILLDGVDMRERPLAWHQGRLGVVQQSPWLRNASLLENIRYGRLDANDEEVRAAAAAVGADAIASSVPEGWDFVVGEAGERLSLGQRQLVSLARAFLKDPDVFILDEATSSIDSETERAIQRAIDRVLRDRISFVIAHRLSTIRRATRIVLVDGGRIVESGTHAELMRARGPYHDLYMEQFVHDRERMVLGGGLTLPE